MSEKCKTCANWDVFENRGCEGYGSCQVLPRLIGLAETERLSLTMRAEFGCSGHTPKAEEPLILKVLVTYVTAGGARLVEDMEYDRLGSEVQDQVVRFMGKPRDEQAGG